MQYVIRTEIEGPGFVAVPNAVAQSAELSADALGVLVYLSAMPGAVRPSAAARARFGFGRDKWRRIARELRAAGLLHQCAARGPAGRIVGGFHVISGGVKHGA